MKKLLIGLGFILGFSQAFANVETEGFNVNLEESKIEWVGTKKVGESHNGDLKIKSGSLNLKKGVPVSGEFVVDMNTINNIDVKDPKFKSKLEGHLKNADFFDVANHPESSFTFNKVKDLGNGQYALEGEMTIRGVKNPETIQATLKVEEDGKLVATADLDVDRTKYGIMYHAESKDAKNEWFFMKWFKSGTDKIINNDLNLKVNLVATKK